MHWLRRLLGLVLSLGLALLLVGQAGFLQGKACRTWACMMAA
jgi:hypothetical protein